MKQLLLLGLVALLVLAWMGRYAVVVRSPHIAYKLDRWTGEIFVLRGRWEEPVKRRVKTVGQADPAAQSAPRASVDQGKPGNVDDYLEAYCDQNCPDKDGHIDIELCLRFCPNKKAE